MKQSKSVKRSKRHKSANGEIEGTPVKRSKRGRPKVPKSARKERYSISLSPKQAQSAIALGKGSISAGVQRLIRRYVSKRPSA